MSDGNFQCLGILQTLRDFHLPSVPYLQILIARVGLGLDYSRPHRRTTISIDGLDKLEGDEPMMIAMNHTDRFNYMPFMKELDRGGFCPLAPWVKGKYYQSPWLGRWLNWCACIPIPSRGFLLTLDWVHRMARKPAVEEYRQLRLLGDGEWSGGSLEPAVQEYLKKAPGHGPQGFATAFQSHFEGFSGQVVRINTEAMQRGYRPLVFPQGTRSRMLTRGFSGVVQMALHTGVRIVPVGVSGSDRLYPGNNPFSLGGHVHYSVGEPFDPREEGAPTDFFPLTISASRAHGQEFERLTGKLMDRINCLLPPEYQYATDDSSRQLGADRFL